MFPDDANVARVGASFFDPFEYLMLRHKEGLLRTDFVRPLGKVSYHVPCHLRVQNLGLKTRDVLKLVPGTEIEAMPSGYASYLATVTRPNRGLTDGTTLYGAFDNMNYFFSHNGYEVHDRTEIPDQAILPAPDGSARLENAHG